VLDEDWKVEDTLSDSLFRNCDVDWLCKLFVTGFFYGEGLLTPCPTPKLEGHPLLSVCDCLFNIFAANLHSWRPFLHPQPEDALCCEDREWDGVMWTGLVSLRIGTGGELL
jgi:hypothetical protein